MSQTTVHMGKGAVIIEEGAHRATRAASARKDARRAPRALDQSSEVRARGMSPMAMTTSEPSASTGRTPRP